MIDWQSASEKVINDMVINDTAPEILYVGTSVGVFRYVNTYNDTMACNVGCPGGAAEQKSEEEIAVKLQISPNPCTGLFSMKLSSPYTQRVAIKLYDTSGRLIDNIFDGKAKLGMSEIQYSNKNLASGIYFVHAEADNRTVTKKIIFQR